MGPTCEISTDETITDEQLLAIDAFLATHAAAISRTRKAKAWDVWVDQRPFHISVHQPNRIEVSAGLNSAEDYDALRRLGNGLAMLLRGVASEPVK